MRPLTESETSTLFTKLSSFLGSNLIHLVDTPDDVRWAAVALQITHKLTLLLHYSLTCSVYTVRASIMSAKK